MPCLSKRMLMAFASLSAIVCISSGDPAHAGSIPDITLTRPPVDYELLESAWKRVLKETGAPSDLPAPPMVLDWQVPKYAWMGFQYPTMQYPHTVLQIGLAPRTLDMLSDTMVVWSVAHEMAHYVFLLRENGYALQTVYREPRPQHCDPLFLRATKAVADGIWDVYHDETERSRMYAKADDACARFPAQ